MASPAAPLAPQVKGEKGRSKRGVGLAMRGPARRGGQIAGQAVQRRTETCLDGALWPARSAAERLCKWPAPTAGPRRCARAARRVRRRRLNGRLEPAVRGLVDAPPRWTDACLKGSLRGHQWRLGGTAESRARALPGRACRPGKGRWTDPQGAQRPPAEVLTSGPGLCGNQWL
jgi:hypothetical protein